MNKKYFDWNGNEIKEGMTIFFVRAKPINFGRMGWIIPEGSSNTGKAEEIWESDEDYEKRTNKDVWELGPEYKVTSGEGGILFVDRCEGSYTFSFPLWTKFSENSIIAIKGISDTKD